MSRRSRQTVILALVVAFSTGLGCATRGHFNPSYLAPPATSDEWRRVEALETGSWVVATLRNGQRHEGHLREADSEGVTLSSDDGQTMAVARSEVETLRVRGPRKSSGKGLLIGAAVGAGAGVALGAGVSEQIDVATRITMPILGAVGAGVGALAGYLISHSRNRLVLVYEAPTPAPSSPRAAIVD